MKDTRKISVIYFMISMILLLMVAFGCSRPYDVDFIHTVNGCDVYYMKTDNPEYIKLFANEMKEHNDNFLIQSDYGIIEVENGDIIYDNVK